MVTLFHSLTCEDDACDPPRTVDNAPRLPVVLDGCPIGVPWLRAPVDAERARNVRALRELAVVNWVAPPPGMVPA